MIFEENIKLALDEIELGNKIKVVHLGKLVEFDLPNGDFLAWAIDIPHITEFMPSTYITKMLHGKPWVCCGNSYTANYFVPLDSNIARLNNHFPQGKVTIRKLSL